MAGHIKQAFLNVSMINRFDGLQQIAKNAGIKLQELSDESYLVFVNAARNKIALLVGPQSEDKRQTMAYIKLRRGQVVDLRTIREIPRSFNGKALNYDKALEAAIDKALAKKAGEHIEMAL